MEMTVQNSLAKIKTKFNVCGENHVIDSSHRLRSHQHLLFINSLDIVYVRL